ncbi:PIHD2 protein, partial [Todus mexicanus]|nr:PIHD2 protein [Todus mexicanus]
DLYRVVDVAYNPDVLQRGEESPEEKERLIRSTLKFVEERCNLPLSRFYAIEPFQLKGSLETMRERLQGRQLPAPRLRRRTGKELTLEQLLKAVGAEDSGDAPELLKEEKVTRPKGLLIEEIPSAQTPEAPSPPAYEMVTVRDAEEKPLRIQLKIELPKVSSVAECDLSVSKDDIVIDVPGKHRLQLNLPESVDEEATTAVFNKGTRVLLITAPVAKPEP